MLGEGAEKEISVIPLSNYTSSRRTVDMSSDIQRNVAENVSEYLHYSSDESTDISQTCVTSDLLRKIRLLNTELLSTSTGSDIYNSISSTFEKNGLSWKNYLSVCTDGAPAMT
jgi:hypothetical protein